MDKSLSQKTASEYVTIRRDRENRTFDLETSKFPVTIAVLDRSDEEGFHFVGHEEETLLKGSDADVELKQRLMTGNLAYILQLGDEDKYTVFLSRNDLVHLAKILKIPVKKLDANCFGISTEISKRLEDKRHIRIFYRKEKGYMRYVDLRQQKNMLFDDFSKAVNELAQAMSWCKYEFFDLGDSIWLKKLETEIFSIWIRTERLTTNIYIAYDQIPVLKSNIKTCEDDLDRLLDASVDVVIPASTILESDKIKKIIGQKRMRDVIPSRERLTTKGYFEFCQTIPKEGLDNTQIRRLNTEFGKIFLSFIK